MQNTYNFEILTVKPNLHPFSFIIAWSIKCIREKGKVYSSVYSLCQEFRKDISDKSVNRQSVLKIRDSSNPVSFIKLDILINYIHLFLMFHYDIKVNTF